MNRSNFISGLFLVSEVITNFFTLNILWVIYNAPLIMFVYLNHMHLTTNDITILLVGIFILFYAFSLPSTVSIIRLNREWLLEKEVDKLTKKFFVYILDYYKNSTKYGMLLTVVLLGWISNTLYFFNTNVIMLFFNLFVGPFVLVFILNSLLYLSDDSPSVKNVLRKAIIITLGRPLLSIAFMLITFIIVYASYTMPVFYILFFSVSIYFFVVTSIFLKFKI